MLRAHIFPAIKVHYCEPWCDHFSKSRSAFSQSCSLDTPWLSMAWWTFISSASVETISLDSLCLCPTDSPHYLFWHFYFYLIHLMNFACIHLHAKPYTQTQYTRQELRHPWSNGLLMWTLNTKRKIKWSSKLIKFHTNTLASIWRNDCTLQKNRTPRRCDLSDNSDHHYQTFISLSGSWPVWSQSSLEKHKHTFCTNIQMCLMSAPTDAPSLECTVIKKWQLTGTVEGQRRRGKLWERAVHREAREASHNPPFTATRKGDLQEVLANHNTTKVKTEWFNDGASSPDPNITEIMWTSLRRAVRAG